MSSKPENKVEVPRARSIAFPAKVLASLVDTQTMNELGKIMESRRHLYSSSSTRIQELTDSIQILLYQTTYQGGAIEQHNEAFETPTSSSSTSNTNVWPDPEIRYIKVAIHPNINPVYRSVEIMEDGTMKLLKRTLSPTPDYSGWSDEEEQQETQRKAPKPVSSPRTKKPKAHK